uniref:(northern house mosquito) hypothetical protein n=2 Tax=Culex pipiens TaxID=7175 RepID=A0A8D8A0V4_CULPI
MVAADVGSSAGWSTSSAAEISSVIGAASDFSWVVPLMGSASVASVTTDGGASSWKSPTMAIISSRDTLAFGSSSSSFCFFFFCFSSSSSSELTTGAIVFLLPRPAGVADVSGLTGFAADLVTAAVASASSKNFFGLILRPERLLPGSSAATAGAGAAAMVLRPGVLGAGFGSSESSVDDDAAGSVLRPRFGLVSCCGFSSRSASSFGGVVDSAEDSAGTVLTLERLLLASGSRSRTSSGSEVETASGLGEAFFGGETALGAATGDAGFGVSGFRW